MRLRTKGFVRTALIKMMPLSFFRPPGVEVIGEKKPVRKLLSRRRGSSYYNRLTQYGNRCNWLKDDRFLRDLEGDSVDTEILDEELRSLQDDEPKTCRGKSVKFLESNPFQIVLCVLVLVDAGVVIAEILLDLHAIRGQYREAADNLQQVLDYVRKEHVDDLLGYTGNDVGTILGLLNRFEHMYNETEPHHRKRRHIETELYDMLSLQLFSSLVDAEAYTSDYSNVDNPSNPNSRGAHGTNAPPEVLTKAPSVAGQQRRSETTNTDYMRTTLRLLADNIRLRNDIAKLYKGIKDVNNELLQEDQSAFNGAYGDDDGVENVDTRSKRNTQEYNTNNEHHVMDIQQDGKTRVRHQHGKLRHDNGDVSSEHIVHDDVTDTMVYANVSQENETFFTWQIYFSKYHSHHSAHKNSEKLLEIAHILHYCSIAILGIFVAQLLLKLYGMGFEFFKKKMEIFDGAIIIASFALDLIFLEGLGNAQGEEAAALLIVFLLWRILRVINGIMVTAKKRQEFRIKLQKRARRRAEKKIEILEEDKSLKEKEIAALKELSANAGCHEDEISACKPRRRSKGKAERVMGRLDMSMGLTSVASLSLGLSMSMSGGPALNNIARANPILAANRRESMQSILSGGRNQQRTSFAPPSRPAESFQNHVRGSTSDGAAASGGDASPNVRYKKVSIENIPEEDSAEQQCLLNPANGEANKLDGEIESQQPQTSSSSSGLGEQDPFLIPPIQPPPPIKHGQQAPLAPEMAEQRHPAGLETVSEEMEPEAASNGTAQAHSSSSPQQQQPQQQTTVTFHFENEVEKDKSDSSSESNATLQANGPVISDSVSLHSNKSDSSQHSPQRNYAINPDLKQTTETTIL